MKMRRMTTRFRFAWISLAAIGALGLVSTSGCGHAVAFGPEGNLDDAMKIRDKLASAKGASSGPGADVGAEKAESAKKFDGWATIKGRFVIEGAAPAEGVIRATKDVEYCGAHTISNESVVVKKDNGLENVVLWLRTPKVPINDEYKKTAADKVTLDNHFCRFEPHVLGLRVGQTLSVKNSDAVAHNTKISGDSLQFNQLIPVGGSTTVSIESPEAQPAGVACSIHDWMSGRLLIRPDPYFAVSDDSGRFEIRDLPAGELEFQVWQESVGGLALNQPDLKWDSKGRFTIELHNGETRDLKDLSVPASVFQGH
jgi:plastocyanin